MTDDVGFTDVNSGGGGFTGVVPGAQDQVFQNLLLVVQTQANALLAPADTPAADTMRLVEDAAGNRVIWTWRTSTAAWKGVQVA